jgi:hypothetical protein
MGDVKPGTTKVKPVTVGGRPWQAVAQLGVSVLSAGGGVTVVVAETCADGALSPVEFTAVTT